MAVTYDEVVAKAAQPTPEGWSDLIAKADRIMPDNVPYIIPILKRISPQVCRNLGEYYFRRGEYDPAILSVMMALRKEPHIGENLSRVKACLVHKSAVSTRVDDKWYEILDIKDHSASTEEIKKNYEQLALIVSPYKCSSLAADGATKLVNEAWEVLSDPTKRNAYDQLLRSQRM